MIHTIKIIDLYDGPKTIVVPSWVRWMAVDASGALWFYQHKPIVSLEHNAWLELVRHKFSISDFMGTIRPPKDYKQEIYTWR